MCYDPTEGLNDRRCPPVPTTVRSGDATKLNPNNPLMHPELGKGIQTLPVELQPAVEYAAGGSAIIIWNTGEADSILPPHIHRWAYTSRYEEQCVDCLEKKRR